MKRWYGRILQVCGGLLLAGGMVIVDAGADVIVEYKFDNNATVFDATNVIANVSAGDFTRGPGVTGTDTTSALAPSGRSLYSNNAGFYQTDESGAISNNDYLSFTVTVDGGFVLDLTGLDFYTLRRVNVGGDPGADEGAGAPSAFSVYSSADGFTTQLGSGTIAVADNSNTFTAQSVGLTSLANLTGATEFRMIFWAGDGIAASTQREWRLDEVSLSGVVVPEPTTLGLMGLVGLGLLLTRRKALIQR